MAPPFSLRISPKRNEKFMVVYLVRSFRTYARIRSLTTGTFNLVVKDRIAFRLSGAPSGLDGLATRANPAVLETHQPYRSHQTLSTCPSHSISTCFPHAESVLDWATRGAEKLRSAQRYGLPLWIYKAPMTRRTLFAQYRSGRQKIEKRS